MACIHVQIEDAGKSTNQREDLWKGPVGSRQVR